MVGRLDRPKSRQSPLLITFLVCLPVLLYTQLFGFLNRFAGRVGDARSHDLWTGHEPRNNDKCWKSPVGQACEDLRLHHQSGDVFLACGYPETRAAFYPPIAWTSKNTASSYREYFLKHNLDTNTTTLLKVIGWDQDLVLHGIDLVQRQQNSNSLELWAVNHDRRHESILKFTHELGSDELVFQREYTHPLIKTPNAVASTGPDSFFISNDHYVYPASGLTGKWLRMLEGQLGPFAWASGIVHCDASGNAKSVECKEVSPKNQHPSANGVLLVDNGRTLLVNEIVKGTTTVYDVDEATKALKVRDEIYLGAGADNLSENPVTGDVAVCVFPSLHELAKSRMSSPDNFLNHTIKGEAAVLLLRKADLNKETEDAGIGLSTSSYHATPELLYWDDGSQITLLTGAVVDPVRKKMVAGGVLAPWFVVCDLDGSSVAL